MLKKLIKALAALILLLIVISVGSFLFINTDQYKTLLETAVANNTGYQLNIAGELELDIFPTLRLTLHDVRLRNPAVPQELASTSVITLGVDRGSLFRGRILIQELLADDFHINYYVDQSGSNIWDSDNLLDDQTQEKLRGIDITDLTNETIDTEDVSLSFDRISIADASIDYQNLSSDLHYRIDNLSLESQNTNVEGRPFNLDIAFRFLNNGLTQPVDIGVRSTIVADISNENIFISDINFALTPMLLTGEIAITSLDDALAYEGSFTSNDFDINMLMQTLGLSEPETIFSGGVQKTQDLALGFQFNGNQEQLSFENFSGSLGATEIEAEANVRLVSGFIPDNISYDIIINNIDLSPFLAFNEDNVEFAISPEESTAPSAASTTPNRPEQDVELSLNILNSLNVLGSIYIESITADELYLQDINIFTNLEDGVLDIEIQPVSAYGGSIQGAARLDGRNPAADIGIQLALKNINIAELPPPIPRFNSFNGSLDAEANYTSSGATTAELVDTLSGSTAFTITENSVDIGVIKQVFTAIAALSPTGEAIQQWPDVIQFSELSGYILLENGITENQQFKVRMDNLDVTGTGGINPGEETFDYDMLFTVLGEPYIQTIPINDLYHNVSWPVDCSAAFDDEVTRYCRPDFTQVREIFSQIATNAARNALEEIITDQVPDLLQDAARGLLRNILN